MSGPNKYRRFISHQQVGRFKGINRFDNLVELGPDYARDLLNVFVSNSGGLEKLRVPQILSPAIAGINNGPRTFYDFQQSSNPATGVATRQVIAHFGTLIYYFDGDWSGAHLIDDSPLNDSLWSWVTSNNLAVGANGSRIMKWTGAAFQRLGFPPPANAPILGAALAPAAGQVGLTLTLGGRKYKASGRNSTTGHIGAPGPASASTGNLANKVQPVNPNVAGLDAQCDQLVLWATLDAGGDYYLHSMGPIANYANYLDVVPDSGLNQAVRAPDYNQAPPAGRYLAKHQNRIIIFCLDTDRQAIAYTNVERTLIGRPEESCSSNNRLRLAIGADEIRGGGIIPQGIIAFSKSNEMYMFRGTIEDITTTAPVSFSAILEELPWKLGAAAHDTIKPSAYGLVWLASDRSIRIFDGSGMPQKISNRVADLLRTITDAALLESRAEVYNFADREWYVLAVATSGSATLNRQIIVDLTPDPAKNAGIFVLGLDCDAIGVIETSLGVRQLCLASGGRIRKIITLAETVNGQVAIPAVADTAAELPAYWNGAYFGNESPEVVRMWRHAHLVTDRPGFMLGVRIVDGERRTFANPRVVPPRIVTKETTPINVVGTRMAIDIIFPVKDIACGVQSYGISAIPVRER